MPLVTINDNDFVSLSRLVLNNNFAYLDSKILNGVFSIYIPNTLGIKSDAGPRIIVTQGGPVNLLQVDLKLPPIGSSLVLDIYQGSTFWTTVTIPDGTESLVVPTDDLPVIVSGTFWRVDITAVGSSFPGSGMTVTLGM